MRNGALTVNMGASMHSYSPRASSALAEMGCDIITGGGAKAWKAVRGETGDNYTGFCTTRNRRLT